MNNIFKLKLITPILVILVVFVFLAFILFPLLLPIKLVSKTPANNSSNQSLVTTVSVTFSRGISDGDKRSISINTSPAIEGILLWSDDDKTVTVNPTTPLEPNITYKITLNYFSKSESWSFKTVSSSTLTPKEEENLQGAVDAGDSFNQQQFLQENPWYKYLPITTSTYFIGYDNNRQVFFVELYPNVNSSLDAQNKEVSNLKSQVITILTRIGASPSENQIEWTVSPK